MQKYEKSALHRLFNKIREYGLNFVFWPPYYILLKSAIILNSMKYKRILASKKGEALTAEVDGHIMYLNPDDDGISKELLLNPDREELSQEMLKELKKDDIVMDIGGNIGYYALKEARKINRLGTAFVIEPVKENVQLLRKNLEANGYPFVKVERLAMGDANGEITMNICENSNLHSVLDRDDYETLGKESVEMVTVDEYAARNKILPTFLRMDVEGYEYEIIKGAAKTLKDSKQLKLMIEFHPGLMGKKKSEEFLNILKKNGFESSYVVFDNPFYPYVKGGTILSRIMLFLESAFMKRKNGHLLGKVHRDMTIDDLINNKELLCGRLRWPHILFEKNG